MPQHDTHSPIARNRRERLVAWALFLLLLTLAAIVSCLTDPTETRVTTPTIQVEQRA